MTVTFDPKQPAGKRVTSVYVDGLPLDMNKTYSIATTDYLRRGGDGYISFQQGKIDEINHRTALLISDLVVQNIRLHGGVSNSLENRLQRVESN